MKVASEPEALLQVLINPAYHFKRIELEAGPLSQWLFGALAEARLPVICVETRHMRAVLKAQINKTDRNDARGIAQMMRVGLYRPVHVKTIRSQKLRMLLTHRKLLQSKAIAANSLLDDGIFDTTGATQAPMISTTGVGATGTSTDDGDGFGDPYAYFLGSPLGLPGAGDFVDAHWLQTDNTVGHAVWDLQALASKAAIFNTIDHEPLPGEAIESTVYLSADLITWTLAQTQRVWLEGFMSNTGILWDGFAYAVGTGTSDLFRYATIIHGGPGAIIKDGDNEINGVLGLDADFDPIPERVPEPMTLALFGAGLGGLVLVRRRRKSRA